jgi:hypothetical protein
MERQASAKLWPDGESEGNGSYQDIDCGYGINRQDYRINRICMKGQWTRKREITGI